ncbi:MAG: hypothetical protein JHD03_07945 [Solirubrobacteraceae bacterium]|nr:hypothetical protein [Solirubrobacteraceae bacterium]
MLKLKSSTTAVLVVAALSAIAAPSASALPYSRDQLLKDSLQVSDVPSSYFINKPKMRELSYSVQPNTNRFEMCVDKDGHKVFGGAPAQRANSAISLYQQGSGSDISATRSVSTDIYAYATKAKAKAAWKALRRSAKKSCAPTAGTTLPFQGVNVAVEATQELKTSKVSSGIPGYTIEQKVALAAGESGPSGLSIWVDGFTAYRMVASTIVRAQFANYTTVSLADSQLTASWRNFTAAAALKVAKRVR